jgi:hypothetical protein
VCCVATARISDGCCGVKCGSGTARRVTRNVPNTAYVICSEKVLSDTRDLTASEIGRLLARVFERQTIFIRTERRDPTGHADALLPFLHDGLLVMNDLSMVDAEIHAHNLSVLEKLQCELVLLPYIPRGRKVRGSYPAEGYLNFAQTKHAIVVPTVGTTRDEAVTIIRRADTYQRPIRTVSSG